jgi:hypothetical protein
MKEITGEELGAMLSNIHTHGELIMNRILYADTKIRREKEQSKIYYSEKELYKVIQALGLPYPIWGKTMTVKQFKKKKS